MNTYDIDTRVQLNAAFVVFGTTTPIDPTVVNLFLAAPDGTISEFTYPDQIVRDDVGLYHVQETLDEAGVWTYKWQGTGLAEVSSPDTRMLVNQTIFSLLP
jgi:hypothetical protein